MNNTLWSPWRSQYVRDPSKHDGDACFICAESQLGSSNDASLVVGLVSDHLILLNLYPYNAGHLLVAPARHVADLGLLTEAEAAGLMKAIRVASQLVERVMQPHGMNIGINQGMAGGAGVPGHLHVHIVPRWNGDSNFMPVIGDVHVVSASMEELRQQYRDAFAAHKGE